MIQQPEGVYGTAVDGKDVWKKGKRMIWPGSSNGSVESTMMAPADVRCYDDMRAHNAKLAFKR